MKKTYLSKVVTVFLTVVMSLSQALPFGFAKPVKDIQSVDSQGMAQKTFNPEANPAAASPTLPNDQSLMQDEGALKVAELSKKPIPGFQDPIREAGVRNAIAIGMTVITGRVVNAKQVTLLEDKRKDKNTSTWTFAITNADGSIEVYSGNVNEGNPSLGVFNKKMTDKYSLDKKSVKPETREMAFLAIMYVQLKKQYPNVGDLTFKDFRDNTSLASLTPKSDGPTGMRFQKGELMYVAVGDSRRNEKGISLYEVTGPVPVGDGSVSGNVSATDASLLSRLYELGKLTLKTFLQFLAADVNNNGQLDKQDIELTLKRAVALPIASFVGKIFAPKISMTLVGAIAQIAGVDPRYITVVMEGQYDSTLQGFLVRITDAVTGNSYYKFARVTKIGALFSVIGNLASADYETAFRAELFYKEIKAVDPKADFAKVSSNIKVTKMNEAGDYLISYASGAINAAYVGVSSFVNGQWLNRLIGKLGDASGNGSYSSLDVSRISQAAAGILAVLPGSDLFKLMDVDFDGIITKADAQIVRGLAVVILLASDFPMQLGNVSGEKGVTAYDASLASQHAVNPANSKLTKKQIFLADVNGDGKVDALDAQLILQLATGSITYQTIPYV